MRKSSVLTKQWKSAGTSSSLANCKITYNTCHMSTFKVNCKLFCNAITSTVLLLMLLLLSTSLPLTVPPLIGAFFNCLTGGACASPVEKIAHQCSKLYATNSSRGGSTEGQGDRGQPNEKCGPSSALPPLWPSLPRFSLK